MMINILPASKNKRKLFAVAITVGVSILLTLLGIYAIGDYGIAIFSMIPIFMGAVSSIIYGYGKKITQGEAFNIAMITVGVYTAGLIAFAIEGLICIFMAAPLAILFTWIGSLIGYWLINKNQASAPTAVIILLCSVPAMSLSRKTVNLS